MPLVFLFMLLACPCFAEPTVSMQLSQGFRRDNLIYTISGPNGDPNILSELRFKHVDLYMSRVTIQATQEDYFVTLMGAYGHVLNGHVRDRDFLFDNRKKEFSDSHHPITGDYTLDAQISAGKAFNLSDTVTLSPKVGFGYYQQKFRLRHGQTDRAAGFYEGEKYKNVKTHNLNTTYRAAWYSPQFGLNVKKSITNRLAISGQYLFLYPLHYHADGFWNRREHQSQNFIQDNKASKSFGNIFTAGCRYKLASRWDLLAEFEEMLFYAKGGSCIRNHKKTNPFRKAKRNASELRLTVSYLF